MNVVPLGVVGHAGEDNSSKASGGRISANGCRDVSVLVVEVLYVVDVF